MDNTNSLVSGNNQNKIKNEEKTTLNIPKILVTSINNDDQKYIIKENEIYNNVVYNLKIKFKKLNIKDIQNIFEILDKFGNCSLEYFSTIKYLLQEVLMKEKLFEKISLTKIKVLSDFDEGNTIKFCFYDFFPFDMFIIYINLKSSKFEMTNYKEVLFDVKFFKKVEK